ncbi:hypothetical protein DQ354_19275 [Arthrobacter sp. AQ5-06]|nr:hypothetical protein DQ354_19275 [Arthrobacter sp. AQ5-06]
MRFKRGLLGLFRWLLTLLWKISGVAPGFFIGAAVGAYFADENTDWTFLLDPKLADVRLWFIVSVVVWIVLSATRRWWDALAAWGEVNSSLLISLFGDSARFAADSVGQSKARRESRRDELAGKIAGYLVRSYPKLKDVRVIVYEMNDDSTELIPLRSEGRRQPSGSFVKGDGGRGDKAIHFVTSNSPPKLVENTKKADPGWKGSGDGYKSYISAPIVSARGHHGMLTIDASAKYALTTEDLKVATLAANMLSGAFASVKTK